MAKHILFADGARLKLKAGIAKLNRAVAVTLGPKGRSVALERRPGSPFISNKGVTVAGEVELEDIYERVAARMLRNVAVTTSQMAGDGTATTIALAAVIYSEGLKQIAAGYDPRSIKRGIDKAAEYVIRELDKLSRSVNGRQDIVKVAAAAANGDLATGEKIAEAIESVGRDGIITVEESRGIAITLDFTDGLRFERGYVSAYFITDELARESLLEDPYILILAGNISYAKDIVALLDKVARQGGSLLIIAEDIGAEALSTLVINKLKGNIRVCAVKAPEYGAKRKDILEDIAVFTGGRVVNAELGIAVGNIGIEYLGRSSMARVDSGKTTLISGAGSQESIKGRIALLKSMADEAFGEQEKEQLRHRLAGLSGGVAVIKVGAVSESEMRQKKARMESALYAARAAVSEGVIPGGGAAFFHCAGALERLRPGIEENSGILAVKKALEYPLKMITANAGLDSASISGLLRKRGHPWGYDVVNNDCVDMFVSGILDPLMVSRIALETAAGIAGLLLTTEAIICDK